MDTIAKRKSARDYREDMENYLNKVEKLKEVVNTRLYTLAVNHPEAPIERLDSSIIKAKSLIGSDRNKVYIKGLSFETQLIFIGTIEKWLADKHPHQQQNLF